MMRSLYSGVSGLKTHQTKMDVIGNNIANVNTTAYKSSSITFSALMSQTTQKASGPNAQNGTGGINAKQIGLGVKAGAINTSIETQGSSQSTGNPFDIMISGSAFFIVNNGNENFFTRDGSFYVDAAGNLAMTSTGYNVMGWGVDETTGDIKQDTVTALRIMSEANMTYPPEATSKAYVAGIIDKNDTDVTSPSGKAMNLNFYDNLGYSYTAKLVMKQSDTENIYGVEIEGLLDAEGNEVDLGDVTLGNGTVDLPKASTLTLAEGYTWNGTELTDGTNVYDVNSFVVTDGKFDFTDEATLTGVQAIAAAYGYEGSMDDFLSLYQNIEGTDPVENITVEQMLINLSTGGANAFPTDVREVNVDGEKIKGGLVTYDANNGKFAGINGDPTNPTLTLTMSMLGGNFSDIEIDFSDSSMYDNKGTSTIGATNGDTDGLGTGRRLGNMSGVTIQNNGMIYATYDNGMTKLIGQIATAEFANASGLEKAGDNLYSATLNSGEFDGIGVDITANGGYMSTGQLEMSNVDLSAEFTEMITTQRGFQANSRIITVSDTLLEELTNLKR